jgi:hypothetical protein
MIVKKGLGHGEANPSRGVNLKQIYETADIPLTSEMMTSKESNWTELLYHEKWKALSTHYIYQLNGFGRLSALPQGDMLRVSVE